MGKGKRRIGGDDGSYDDSDSDDTDKVIFECFYCGKEIQVAPNESLPKRCLPKSEGGCARVTSWEYTDDEGRQRHLGKYFKDKNLNAKFLPRRLVMDLIDEARYITFEDTDEVYVYNAGVYHEWGENQIKKRVQDILGDETSNHRVNEVIEGVKRETYISRESVCDTPRYIPLKNGVYDLVDGELKQHSPDRIFLHAIPVRYNPEAECPHIKQFLSEVLHEDHIPVMQELCGYILYTSAPYDVITLFVGEGANGKGTWLNVLERFYGEENLSNVSMSELSNSRFAKGQLYAKLANICNEVERTKKGAMANTGTLKKIAGGDTLWTDKKWSKKGMTFKPYAKLIHAVNEAPTVTEDTIAWWRRIMIIPFPNTFLGDDQKNRDLLIQSMTTEEELSGFFNWVLEGLNRLLDNNGFSYEVDIDEIREQYYLISDSISAFVNTECLLDITAKIPKDALYTCYVRFCTEHNSTIKDKSVFFRKLPAACSGHHIEKSRPQIGGKRVQILEGITVANPEEYDGVTVDLDELKKEARGEQTQLEGESENEQ